MLSTLRIALKLKPQLLPQNQVVSDYENLYQYISKNKILKEFIAKIKPKNKKVEKLFVAINNGDSNAKIFKNENCYLYLLYLIKENRKSRH